MKRPALFRLRLLLHGLIFSPSPVFFALFHGRSCYIQYFSREKIGKLLYIGDKGVV